VTEAPASRMYERPELASVQNQIFSHKIDFHEVSRGVRYFEFIRKMNALNSGQPGGAQFFPATVSQAIANCDHNV
jgi:hypothetical protein